MLSAKNITRKSIEYEKIIDIYQQSFPENEKYPMWLLLLMSYRKSVDFLAFYDKEVFCGFIYLIHYDNMTFVLYLATDGNIRSKGYGSAILNWVVKEYPRNDIVLNIENVDKSYPNYEQRKRRQQFYLRNGFYATGYILKCNNDIYDVLSTNIDFDREQYEKLFKRFSFGMIKVKLKNK